VVVITGLSEPLHASFSADATEGKAPLRVQFMDTSTGIPVCWNWSFGDGATSTDQNPVHIYTTPGNYNVSLTVSDSGGGNDTEVKTDFITAHIEGDFNGNERVDVGDVSKVAYMAVGKAPVEMTADFNENGVVDIGDAAKIAYYYVRKIASL